MKDYSLNSEDKKKYIKKYKPKKGKIIIKFANRKKDFVSNTEENKQKIESKMEDQARKAEVKPLTPFEETFTMILPLTLPWTLTNLIDNKSFSSGFLFGLAITGSIIYPSKYINCMIKEKDIEKLHYFLDYKKELNDSIINDIDMLQNISKKATRIIKKQLYKQEKPLNINNIDKISLKDLKAIKENIDSIYDLNKNSILEDQGPVLKIK